MPNKVKESTSNQSMSPKKLLMKVFSWLVIGAVVWFFAHTLYTNWQRLSDVDLGLDVWGAAAFVSFVLAVAVSGVLWGKLTNHLSTDSKMSLKDAIRIHCASWLLKYIPGQAGSYLNKLAWGKKNGFSKKTITTSFIYENTLMVLAGIILSLPIVLVVADQVLADSSVYLPLLMIIPLALLLSPKVFRFVLNLMMKMVKRSRFQESDFLSGRDIVKYQLQYLLPRLLNGVGFVFLAISLLPIEPHMYLGLAAAYVLAGVVGMLAIFVPSGIGVREAVIVLLASAYMPVEQAIILSLVARLYATVADIGVGIIYLSLNKWRITQQ